MRLIKIICLIISCIGYYTYTKRKYKLKDEFIPIILIAIIGCTEFFAGILNILKISTYAIGIVGIILFFKNLYIIIKNKEKIEFNNNLLIMFILYLWAIWILKGTILIHYDNFSHWAMIIKEMLITDKLPNFASNTILFTAYPPGTACFVYFICKYIGGSEACMLFGQSIVILSSLFTLFAFCEKENKTNYIISIVAILYLLIANIFINQLLVDTVLSVLGIAGISIIIYYKDNNKKSLYILMPILCFLMIVKNSGIFFVIIDILIWLLFYIKNNSVKAVFKTKYILIIFIPLIMMLLWFAHTDLVFDNSNITKHAMSAENYITNVSNKDKTQIIDILSKILNKMVDMKNKDNQIFVILLIPFIVIIIVSHKDKELQLFIIKMFIMYFLSYILYQLSLAGMYIFSMTGSEAQNLAAYGRYFKTILMFNYGILVITILQFINNYKLKNKKIFCSIVLLVFITIPAFLYRGSLKQLYIKQNSDGSVRSDIINLKHNYNIEDQKTYIIYTGDKQKNIDDDYIYYICKYDFRSPNVKIIKSFADLDNINEVFNYDYFIILDKKDEVKDFLNTIGGNKELDVIRFK